MRREPVRPVTVTTVTVTTMGAPPVTVTFVARPRRPRVPPRALHWGRFGVALSPVLLICVRHYDCVAEPANREIQPQPKFIQALARASFCYRPI